MNKKTITIPLKKATYEDIQALNIDLQTQLFKIKKDFKDEKEIEILLFNNIKEKDKEIERLNNIINEMEKFLKINSEKDDYDLTEYNKGVNNAYNYTLDYLKELKEKK